MTSEIITEWNLTFVGDNPYINYELQNADVEKYLNRIFNSMKSQGLTFTAWHEKYESDSEEHRWFNNIVAIYNYYNWTDHPGDEEEEEEDDAQYQLTYDEIFSYLETKFN